MLPIALGDATKTVPYVMDGRKIYEFTVTWGAERTTDDLEGEAVNSSDQRPDEQAIRDILPNYTGVIMQTPPQFSAIKIAGERAYDLARDGETVEIPAREVEIHRLTLLACPDANTAHFEVNAAREPMCVHSHATWAAISVATAISRNCGVPWLRRSART